jgi:hypothetical protein
VNAHTVIIEIGVLPEYAVQMPRFDYNMTYATMKLMEKLQELITVLEEQQAAP